LLPGISGLTAKRFLTVIDGLRERGLDVQKDGTLNQLKGQHDAKSTFPALQYAFPSEERPPSNADASTDPQVGMWLSSHTLTQRPPEPFDLLLGERYWCPVKTDQPHNTWKTQYIESASERNPDENVPRKERQSNQLASVFPTVDGFVERQIMRHPARFELLCHAFLML
jgi:hypothetical protein